MIQIQMAVAAMESALGTSGFDELRKICWATLPKADNRSDLERVLKARHEFVHQGRILANEDAVRNAQIALSVAYVLFDLSTGMLEHFPTIEKYRDYIELRLALERARRYAKSALGNDAEVRLTEAIAALFQSKKTTVTARTDE